MMKIDRPETLTMTVLPEWEQISEITNNRSYWRCEGECEGECVDRICPRTNKMHSNSVFSPLVRRTEKKLSTLVLEKTLRTVEEHRLFQDAGFRFFFLPISVLLLLIFSECCLLILPEQGSYLNNPET